MIRGGDGVAALARQVLARLVRTGRDRREHAALHMDRPEREEPRCVLKERGPAVVEDRVAVPLRHALSVDPSVAEADRQDRRAGRDGCGEERVPEGLHGLAVRGRPLREEHHRGPVLQSSSDVPDLLFEARRVPALHEDASAEPGEQAERERVLQFDGRDEDRGTQGGEDEDVDVRHMVRNDQIAPAGEGRLVCMADHHADAQYPESGARKEGRVPGQEPAPSRPSCRQERKAKGEQRIEEKHREDRCRSEECAHVSYAKGIVPPCRAATGQPEPRLRALRLREQVPCLVDERFFAAECHPGDPAAEQ
jgi:hypothetical protein